MKYPNDFQLIRPNIGQGEDTIDSFSLLTSIINDLNYATFKFRLANSLPIIIGDFDTVKDCLKEFIIKAITNFSGFRGTCHILFREDLESSFLGYFIEESEETGASEDENHLADLVDVIYRFNLGICPEIQIGSKQQITESDTSSF
ncbi:hypothetical protein LZF95_20060 [Algoriphagus sp. AGSA1]|uniref:hypothetical protein n=1 Tax=Algoriphagus sp. AGSA1 TaxID=2907213 RepID=UPI001F441481|nr:hypothetical protein [Algoriphagus sp. AGSA1]MCE7056985.1 hypothetical protein [Algoriphagus sp. AGSA1]